MFSDMYEHADKTEFDIGDIIKVKATYEYGIIIDKIPFRFTRDMENKQKILYHYKIKYLNPSPYSTDLASWNLIKVS